MESTTRTRLETLLRQAQLLMPTSSQTSSSLELQPIFTSICRLVLDERTYQELWDEPILAQLDWLFQGKPPAATFDNQVAELRQRVQQTQRVHDFFFQILHRDTSVDMVYETLVTLFPVESSLLHRLKSSSYIESIREADSPPSEKIAAFLTVLQEDAGLDLVD